MADSDSTSPDKKRQEPPPLEFMKPGEAAATPPPSDRPAAWVTRPEDYQQPVYAQPPAPPRTGQPAAGNRARIAGIVLFAAAAASAASFLIASLTPLSPSDYANATSDLSVYELNQVCGLMVIWSQAAMAIGGIMVFQRMNYRLSVGLSFFALILLGGYTVAVLSFTFDPVLAIAAVLAIVGFVLAVVSRREFRT